MKVFAGFIRKYYQNLFSFISKNITPILSSVSNGQDIIISGRHLHNSGYLDQNQENTCYKIFLDKEMIPICENETKYIHVLQVSWELEETFNGSFTHSHNSSGNKSKTSSYVVSEYPSMNDILRDEVEEEKTDGTFNSRQMYPQIVPRL